jgi:PAS domain S-box-containing protein
MVKKKILLVEDEGIEALDIKRSLNSFGYEVPYVASSGEEAVEKALEIMPDLILMDIFLKGEIDGIEAASKIKDLNIPVIYLTAHPEELTIERAKLTELYGYMIKPYKPTELKYAIEIAIYKNQKDKELKESEESYRRLAENSKDVIYRMSLPDGQYQYVSPAAEKMFKISPEECYKSPLIIKELIHPDYLDYFRDNWEKLLKGDVPPSYEYKIIDKDGMQKWLYQRNSLIKGEKGNPMAIEGIITDISRRKKDDEIINLNQIHLENAIDLAHLANWEFDVNNGTFIFNDRFYAIFGTTAAIEGGYTMSLEEYIKKYIHPEDVQFIEEGFQSSFATHESGFGDEFEHRIIRGDGEIRFIAVYLRVVPAIEGRGPYVYGTIQDISDRKISEERLKQSLEEKEMLLKEIHHRVKNNLMTISSLLSLQSRYIKDKESLDYFKETQNRARSMALIHERLYQSTDLKMIEFGEYIRSLSKELFRVYAADSGLIELKMNIEDIFLDVDAAIPLGMIINELITNSLKHAFPEGMDGEINVNFYNKDDRYEFTLKDNGIGFPEDLDFQNTDSLGLQIINTLTNQLDGEIELDRNNGTQFKITFKELNHKH